MILSRRAGYSKYLKLISLSVDILVITLLFPAFFTEELQLNAVHFAAYQFASWCTISYFSGFYEVYRYTTPVQLTSKLFKQGIIFLFVDIAFFPFAKQTIFSGEALALFLIASFIIIGSFKFLLFYYLKKYRVATGSNYRSAIIIGYTPDSIKLKDFFDNKVEYGYRFSGFFSDKVSNPEIMGGISGIKSYVIENNVDEIYCSLNEISNFELKDLVDFADTNHKTIKFIPDSKEIFSKNLRIDYYEFFPVLSLRKTALHEPAAQVVKRIFDVAFSALVMILLLSWFTPLMALLIKLESRGSVFFKQSRPGLNGQEFFCYKFRSMQINETTEQSVTRNDPRVTRIGKFIRKTSIDELPQFLNVLRGEMTIVGPRPHLWSQNNLYSTKIKKYMSRLYVKPGITGLAQVRGFRGEITNDDDMINRIRYDVFYIENWSLLLDLKIIIQTVVNIFMGEEKAY